jgi:Ca2+-binding EF-hand superfamily protein
MLRSCVKTLGSWARAVAPILVAPGIVVGAAMAQPADETFTPLVQERFGFTAADTDGDDFISEAELARDAAAGFSGLDKDRSGTLTPQELGPHDPSLFARVDRNGDGVLSFSEIIVHKVGGFEKADRDGDGLVSFEEMVDEARSELGVQ